MYTDMDSLFISDDPVVTYFYVKNPYIFNENFKLSHIFNISTHPFLKIFLAPTFPDVIYFQ